MRHPWWLSSKNPPAMQETQQMQVWSLDQKDPLEEGMTIHSSILAWRIPWTEEPGGLHPIGSARVGQDWCVLALKHDVVPIIFPLLHKRKVSPGEPWRDEGTIQIVAAEAGLQPGLSMSVFRGNCLNWDREKNFPHKVIRDGISGSGVVVVATV